MRRYTVLLVPDPDDGGFTVTMPALPGAIAEGDTLDEALEHARRVIAELLEVVAAAGVEIPSQDTEPLLRIVEVA